MLFIRQEHIMRCFPVLFWLISLLSVADQGKYHLDVPEGPIKAQVGSDVVLPCRVEPPVNASNATVEWMFNSSKTVHLFRNEADDPESQDDRYKDRTTLNHAMLELGNVSLKLSNVTKNDEGIYSCFVRRLPDDNKLEKRHVTLIVDGIENENADKHSGDGNGAPGNSTDTKDGNGAPGNSNDTKGPDPGVNGGAIAGGVVGAVILIIILIFITYCVVRCCRGKQIFPRCCNKSQNEHVRNDGDRRGNGNQGDGAEKMPLQNLGKPNQNV